MQTRREKLGYEMMLLPSLEAFVPQNDPLRRLNRVLDLSFVHEAVRDRYCQDNGRSSIDPEVVIRLFVLQAFEGIVSVRELMRHVYANFTYRWFIGYGVMEEVPDHSTLSKALDRFGDELFDALFQRSIAQCQRAGLIEGRVLHLDATTIRADLDAGRKKPAPRADADARVGRFPSGQKQPGYKQQTVADGKARVIVDVAVMPADCHDQKGAVEAVDRAVARVGRKPEAVCADAAYANGPNAAAMEERRIRWVSPPERVGKSPKLPPDQFLIADFAYDEQHDLFVCPAGVALAYAGTEATGRRRRRYRAPKSACAVCALKARCTISPRKQINVSIHHGALVRLRADSRTDSFNDLYRARSHVIEGLFGEGKQWHGLRRAWRRGLSNMLIQSLLISAVLNFKRLMGVARPITRFCVGLLALIYAIKEAMQTARTLLRHYAEPGNHAADVI